MIAEMQVNVVMMGKICFCRVYSIPKFSSTSNAPAKNARNAATDIVFLLFKIFAERRQKNIKNNP